MPLPRSAADHYQAQQQLAVQAGLQINRIWAAGMGDDFDLGWSRIASPVFATIVAAQTAAAADAIAYVPQVLTEQGIDPGEPAGIIDPARFAGGTSEGYPLESVIAGAPIKAKQAMAVVQSSSAALASAGGWLGRVALDAIRDANLDGASAAIIARPKVGGFVRMLNPPSCSRCVVLAGKFYRWNEGFPRHPRCDCRHIPSSENKAGDVTTDPYAYFRSLDKAGQDRLFGVNDAQAIRDGGDLYRVANVRMRGLAKGRGRMGWQARRYGTPSKLTIDEIHAAAGGDREKAIRLLGENGFLVGGQVPGGEIKGNLPDPFSAGGLGRGGTRKGATLAYRKAVASGVRDPLEPATQTAAERRLHSAVLMKQAVDRGSNPFATNTARNPLTPQIRALVERNYRRQIAGLATAPEQLRSLAKLLGITP